MNWKAKFIHRMPGPVRDRLLDSHNNRKIAKNMIWLSFDKGYSMTASFVVGIFVARYLGPERFGLMSYAISFVAIFRVLGTLGLEEILTRELVYAKGQEGCIFASAFLLRIAGTLLATVAIIIAIYFIKPDSPETRLLVCIASLINFGNLLMIFQRWFASQLQARYFVIASNIALTIFALAKLGLIYMKAPTGWFVAASAAQVALSGMILTGIYISRNKQLAHTWEVSKLWLKKLLNDAWPRMISGVSVSISVNISIIIIGSLLSEKELGEYSLAYRLFVMLLFFSNIICQSLAPSLTKVYENNPSAFPAQLLRMYRLLFVSNLLIALAMLPVALWGIPLIYGQQYLASGKLLAGLLCGLPFYGLGAGRTWFIIVNRAYRYGMWMAIFTSLVNILCVYGLIMLFGSWGAVSALFLYSVVPNLLVDIFFKKYRLQTVTAWRAILSIIWIPEYLMAYSQKKK